MIKNHLLMLKYLFKASKSYLPVNLFNEIVSFLKYFIGLLFFKFITDYIVYDEINIKDIAIYFGVFYIFELICMIINYWINSFYNEFERDKIKKNIQRIVYNKVNDIDILCYENEEFFNEYSRAVFYVQDRLYMAGGFVLHLFRSILYVFTIIKLFSSIDILFIVAGLILCIEMFVTTFLTNKIMIKRNYVEAPVYRKSGYFEHIFSSYQYVKELKLYNFHDLIAEKYNESKYTLRKIKISILKKLITVLYGSSLISSLIKGFIYIYVINKIINGQLTIGDLALIYATVYTLGNTLGEMMNIIPNLKQENVYVGYVNKILEYVPQIPKNTNGINLKRNESLDLSFENVYFSYPNAPEHMVLKNITLNIEKGTKLAVVGHNGSGKSTFVKLLLYLYNVNKGKIICNGYSYDNYVTESLRSSFGVVFQDFQVFAISIAENVLMHELENEDDKRLVWEALEFAGLSDKVKTLDKGLDSILTKEFDDEGMYLSGGEIQKLAIARAYARQCDVLVFDEPSSAMDPIAEREIFKKLLKLGDKKTVIYISHRLSSVVDSDQIVLFDNGEIIERGTHQELMTKKGKYHEMFMLQAENYNA